MDEPKKITGKKQDKPCERCGAKQIGWAGNDYVVYEDWDNELGTCSSCIKDIKKIRYDALHTPPSV